MNRMSLSSRRSSSRPRVELLLSGNPLDPSCKNESFTLASAEEPLDNVPPPRTPVEESLTDDLDISDWVHVSF